MPTIITYLLEAKGIENVSRSHLREIFSTRYDLKMGFGFANFNRIDRNLLSSNLIYSVVRQERVFDAEEGAFVYENRLAFSEVPFEVDLQKSIILVKGGVGKIKRLINVLGTLFENKIALDYTRLNIDKTIRSLHRSTDNFILQGVIIQNYSPEANISGKFSARVIGTTAAEHILSDYSGELIEFIGQFESDGVEARVRISSSGIIAISSTEEGIRTSIEIVKQIAQENANA